MATAVAESRFTWSNSRYPRKLIWLGPTSHFRHVLLCVLPPAGGGRPALDVHHPPFPTGFKDFSSVFWVRWPAGTQEEIASYPLKEFLPSFFFFQVSIFCSRA